MSPLDAHLSEVTTTLRKLADGQVDQAKKLAYLDAALLVEEAWRRTSAVLRVVEAFAAEVDE